MQHRPACQVTPTLLRYGASIAGATSSNAPRAVLEAQAFVQTPMALVACSALAVLSVAAHGLVNVRRDHHLVGPITLYLLAVAAPGERKTTCDGVFSPALRQWESAQFARLSPELASREGRRRWTPSGRRRRVCWMRSRTGGAGYRTLPGKKPTWRRCQCSDSSHTTGDGRASGLAQIGH